MGAGNMIAGRYAVKGIKQEVEQASNEALLQGFQRADITANASDQLIRFSNNMKTGRTCSRKIWQNIRKLWSVFNIADSHAKQFSMLDEMLSPNALERIGKTGDRAQNISNFCW